MNIEQLPRPQLVFRFYNNNSSGANAPSGMHAELLQQKEIISPQSHIDSEVFCEEAVKHFSWT